MKVILNGKIQIGNGYNQADSMNPQYDAGFYLIGYNKDEEQLQYIPKAQNIQGLIDNEEGIKELIKQIQVGDPYSDIQGAIGWKEKIVVDPQNSGKQGIGRSYENAYSYGTTEINGKTYELFVYEVTKRDGLQNAFDGPGEERVIVYESSAAILQSSISTWYKVLRRVALIGLLSILVYIGIRIMTSAPSGKAKYKELFLNWLVAVCLLYVLHYLMVFIVTMSEKVTEIFLKTGEPNIIATLPPDTKIEQNGEMVDLPGYKDGESSKENPQVWSCSFTGYLRLLAGEFKKDSNDTKMTTSNMGYMILYLIMVVYTLVFTFMYLRRVLYMAFLTMIAPLIALTYPLDKIKDSKAQALGLWLREYLFNALIQPVHLILYIMVVSNVMAYVEEHPVFAIVALGFLLPAEKFVRKMFGFDRTETFGQLADAAVGATAMAGIGRLSSMATPSAPHEDRSGGNVRTSDENPNYDVPKPPEESENEQEVPTNAEQEQTVRQIQNSYRALSAQGNDREEIRRRLYNQYDDHDLVDNTIDEMEGGSDRESGGNRGVHTATTGGQRNGTPRRASRNTSNPIADAGESNAEFANLRLPHITPASEKNAKERGFMSKMAGGLLNVGFAKNRRRVKGRALKTIGKYTGKAIFGTTLGLLGLALGASSGSPGNTAKYVAAGLGVGLTVGGTVGSNAGEFLHEQKEAFREGYNGNEGYENKEFDRRFLESKELQGMILDRDVHPELGGGITGEVSRNITIATEAQEYHRVGITDAEHIKTCMKSGLTSEEGIYAVELAKTIKKNSLSSSPRKLESYRQRYLQALQNQARTQEEQQKIKMIWDTAMRIRFK